MADALYTNFKTLILSGGIDLTADDIKVVAVDSADYTFSAAHQFYSSVSAGAVGTPTLLENVTVAGGVFDADDVVLSAVTGDQFEALVIYKDTGSPSTSPLICYIDSATGLPTTPNSADINIIWSSGSNKIFAIGG